MKASYCVAAHRAIDVSLGIAARADLVVARLHPRHVHIDRMTVHDRRDGVEKGERAFARQSSDRLGQRHRGERAGRDDDIVPVLRRQAGDLAAVERYKGMTEKRATRRLARSRRGRRRARRRPAPDARRRLEGRSSRGRASRDAGSRPHWSCVVGSEGVRATSSASGVSGAQLVVRSGRISCRTTGTPEFAACHAASEPARPPPMMWIGCMGALVTKPPGVVNGYCGERAGALEGSLGRGRRAGFPARLGFSGSRDQAETWLATERRTTNSISPRRMPISSSSRLES